jgi:uncharacterized protein (DUF4415 family)
MASKRLLEDTDNPEWSAADFARAKLGREVLPTEFLQAFKRTPGRPKGSTRSQKKLISLRLDADVIERFRATGDGWQSRINETLRKAKIIA